MHIITRNAALRFAIGLGVIAIMLGAYAAGRESGISFGYNRGYLYGFSACRACDRMMNATKAGDVVLPLKQLNQEGLAFEGNERRYHLNALNDRYLDPAVVEYDNGAGTPSTRIVHTSTTTP